MNDIRQIDFSFDANCYRIYWRNGDVAEIPGTIRGHAMPASYHEAVAETIAKNHGFHGAAFRYIGRGRDDELIAINA